MTAVVYVDNGTDLVSDALLAIVGASVTASGFYIAWGTGGSSTFASATNTDVDLYARATEAAASATSETQPSGDTNQWVAQLQTTTVKTIEEVGLFINSTGTATDMIIHNTHGGLSLATDDEVRYTITLQQT